MHSCFRISYTNVRSLFVLRSEYIIFVYIIFVALLHEDRAEHYFVFCARRGGEFFFMVWCGVSSTFSLHAGTYYRYVHECTNVHWLCVCLPRAFMWCAYECTQALRLRLACARSLWPQGWYLIRVNNRDGHWIRWMSAGRNIISV